MRCGITIKIKQGAQETIAYTRQCINIVKEANVGIQNISVCTIDKKAMTTGELSHH